MSETIRRLFLGAFAVLAVMAYPKLAAWAFEQSMRPDYELAYEVRPTDRCVVNDSALQTDRLIAIYQEKGAGATLACGNDYSMRTINGPITFKFLSGRTVEANQANVETKSRITTVYGP